MQTLDLGIHLRVQTVSECPTTPAPRTHPPSPRNAGSSVEEAPRREIQLYHGFPIHALVRAHARPMFALCARDAKGRERLMPLVVRPLVLFEPAVLIIINKLERGDRHGDASVQVSCVMVVEIL